MDSLVMMRNVTFKYPGSHAGIENVNLDIYPGEIVVLLGPSGVGKSTILHIIAGLLRPKEGYVKVSGNTSILLQNYEAMLLYPTVFEEILHNVLVINQGNRGMATEMVNMVMSRFKLQEFRDRHTYELSAGEKKRLALALTLMMEPDVLLLDEPLTDADLIAEEIIVEHLAMLTKRKGAAIIATNDLSTSIEFGTRIIIVSRGGRILREFKDEEDIIDNMEYLRSLGIRTPRYRRIIV